MVGSLLFCVGSTAGFFIDCSIFSAASCTSDLGLKTGPVLLTLAVCLATGHALMAFAAGFRSIFINYSFDSFDRSPLFILIG